MTDRYNGFLVVLDRDLREDDAARTLDALQMIRGVVEVEPVKADPSTQAAEARAAFNLRERVRRALEP